MDPLLGMFLGSAMMGTMSAAGGTFLSAREAAKQRKFQSQEAQKQRDWMTEMSNTAHQREVDDLYQAGLNPILSATGGSGASTPSSGLPSGAMGTISDPAQSAVAMLGVLSKAFKEQKLLDAEAEKLEAETKFIHSQNWNVSDRLRLDRDRLNWDIDRYHDDKNLRIRMYNLNRDDQYKWRNQDWENKGRIETYRAQNNLDIQSAKLEQERKLTRERFENELQKTWIQAGAKVFGDLTDFLPKKPKSKVINNKIQNLRVK